MAWPRPLRWSGRVRDSDDLRLLNSDFMSARFIFTFFTIFIGFRRYPKRYQPNHYRITLLFVCSPTHFSRTGKCNRTKYYVPVFFYKCVFSDFLWNNHILSWCRNSQIDVATQNNSTDAYLRTRVLNRLLELNSKQFFFTQWKPFIFLIVTACFQEIHTKFKRPLRCGGHVVGWDARSVGSILAAGLRDL